MRMRTRSCMVTAFGIASIVSMCVCPTASAQARSTRTVLVINWGPEDSPPNPAVTAAIQKSLTSDPDLKIDYFVEYLESGVFAPEDASQALRDYIHRKYRGRRIDLVIAIADPALRFVLDHRAELFPDAPIVFSGVALPETIDRSAGAGVTAVMRGIAYAETLKLALQLHPSTERVFVVAKLPDSQVVNSVKAELRAFSGRVQLTYLDEETLPRLLAAVKAVPSRSLILYILRYVPDDPNSITYSVDAVRLLAEVSPVPVYGTNERYVGSGIVGGVVRRNYETGARVGEIARQILRGARAQDIPIENARLVPIFDWRQVRRWGIDPSRFPPESDIQFRTPTVWESYRGYIIGTVAVVTAQLLLIAGLLAQRARRRRAEETILAREATLRTSYERSRQLAGRLINAQEAARAGIARDLHDDVCQQLTCLSVTVSGLKKFLGRHSGPSNAAGLCKARARDARHLRQTPASVARTAPVNAGPGWPRADTEGALRGSRGCAPGSSEPHDRGRSSRPPARCCRVLVSNRSGGTPKRACQRPCTAIRGLASEIWPTRGADRHRRWSRVRSRGGAPGWPWSRTCEHRRTSTRSRRGRSNHHCTGQGNHDSRSRSGRRRCEYGGHSPHVDDVSPPDATLQSLLGLKTHNG